MKELSKTLSYYLRHAPHELGLCLQPGGWVEVDELLAGLQKQGMACSREELARVVASSDKQRFALEGSRIRANQGHSVSVDLELTPEVPPDLLYHGTTERFVDSILREGLKKGERHHVHLSLDVETARRVGLRRGPPVLLVVDSAAMHRHGCLFYRSANSVWLSDAVPPEYLRLL